MRKNKLKSKLFKNYIYNFKKWERKIREKHKNPTLQSGSGKIPKIRKQILLKLIFTKETMNQENINHRYNFVL